MRTKKDIVKHMIKEHNITSQQGAKIFQLVLDDVVQAICENGRLELRNFGVFRVKHRAARMARNPRTNQPMRLPARAVLTFEASQRIADRIEQNWPAEKVPKDNLTSEAAS